MARENQTHTPGGTSANAPAFPSETGDVGVYTTQVDPADGVTRSFTSEPEPDRPKQK